MRALYWQEVEIREYSFNESGEKDISYKRVDSGNSV